MKIWVGQLHAADSKAPYDPKINRYVLFNNLVLAAPKMGQMSKSGTFPKYEMAYVLRLFFCHPCIRKKNLNVVKLLGDPKMRHVVK